MLRIHLLGPLRLFVDQEPVKFLTTSRTVPLLAYLLLHGRQPLQRNWLAYTLWPECSEADARGNLRRFLHELRRLLPPEEEEQPWIQADTATIQWNPAADLWLDVDAFEQAAAAHPADAAALYSGDLLADLYDDWIIADRERLRILYLDTLALLVRLARRAHDLPAAVQYAQRMLQHDPLREDAVRELMSARHGAGDRAGALQEYQRFEQRIRSELGVAPMLETSALYEAIAKQLPVPGEQPVGSNWVDIPVVPATGWPTPAPEDGPPGNLPAQLTAFVGRERELAALHSLMGDERTAPRLLTLTGTGGSGKSRLGLEFAVRLRSHNPERVPDGCFLVGLAGVRSPAMVLPAIADTLHIKEAGGQPLADSLRAFLQPRRLLLLLDNFEHLLEAAPQITELLAGAPGLRVLVTSRAALRVYGEHEYQVQPLPVPSNEPLPAPGDLARVASVALFVARSRAVNPAFTLNSENAADVARICIELDGLPLALELAAARSKILPPAAILVRLEHRLSFLVARDRQAHDRHQTLRAALDWSYKLLPEAQQRLFRRLAAFAGSFTLEAAEALCSADTAYRGSSLAGIESLLDNSLLQPLSDEDEPPPRGMGSGLRLRMLATVREYALERLAEENEEEEVCRALAEQLLSLMQQSRTGLRNGAQAAWLRHLENEHDNLRSALRWSLAAQGDPALGLRLASTSGLFWLVAGHWREGIGWLLQALEGDPDAPPEQRAPAHAALGFLLMASGDLVPASPHFAEALRLFRLLDNQHGAADALFGLGRILTRQRHYAEGKAMLVESLELALALGYEWRIGYAQTVLAMVALEQDDLTEAAARMALAVESAKRLQNNAGLAQMYTGLGELARMEGRYDEAERCYLQALELAQPLGQKARIMMVQHNLGHVALHGGQTRRAATHFKQALQLGRELPDKENNAMCVLGLAGVAAAEGNVRSAALLFGAGEAALQALGADLAPPDRIEYERNLACARALRFPNADFDRVRQEGQALPTADAESLALAL